MASRIRCRLTVSINDSSSKAASRGTTCRIEIGGVRGDGGGTMRAVVVTVTVDVCGVTPSVVVTDAGDAVHVPSFSVGVLVQVRSTCELKPPTGVTVAMN